MDFGSGEEAEKLEQAAATVRAYLRARADGRWGAACRVLAAKVYREWSKVVTGSAESFSCPQAVADFSAAPRMARRIAARFEIIGAQIEGGQAYVVYRRPDGVFFLPARQIDDAWKVTAREGSPLP